MLYWIVKQYPKGKAKAPSLDNEVGLQPIYLCKQASLLTVFTQGEKTCMK